MELGSTPANSRARSLERISVDDDENFFLLSKGDDESSWPEFHFGESDFSDASVPTHKLALMDVRNCWCYRPPNKGDVEKGTW